MTDNKNVGPKPDSERIKKLYNFLQSNGLNVGFKEDKFIEELDDPVFRGIMYDYIKDKGLTKKASPEELWSGFGYGNIEGKGVGQPSGETASMPSPTIPPPVYNPPSTQELDKRIAEAPQAQIQPEGGTDPLASEVPTADTKPLSGEGETSVIGGAANKIEKFWTVDLPASMAEFAAAMVQNKPVGPGGVPLPTKYNKETGKTEFDLTFDDTEERELLSVQKNSLLKWAEGLRNSPKAQELSKGAVQSVFEVIDDPSKFPEWLTGVIIDTGNQAVLSVGTAGTGLFAQTIGNTYSDAIKEKAKQSGKSIEQVLKDGDGDQIISATTFGLAAGMLEKLGLDKVLGKEGSKVLTKSVASRLKDVFGSSGVEGSTEVGQEILQKVGALVSSGISIEDALDEVISVEFGKKLVDAFAAGAAGGGAIAGARNIGEAATEVGQDQAAAQETATPEQQQSPETAPPEQQVEAEPEVVQEAEVEAQPEVQSEEGQMAEVEPEVEQVAEQEMEVDGAPQRFDPEQRDNLFDEAAQLAVVNEGLTLPELQRKLQLGYNRATAIMQQMEASGIIDPEGNLSGTPDEIAGFVSSLPPRAGEVSREAEVAPEEVAATEPQGGPEVALQDGKIEGQGKGENLDNALPEKVTLGKSEYEVDGGTVTNTKTGKQLKPTSTRYKKVVEQLNKQKDEQQQQGQEENPQEQQPVLERVQAGGDQDQGRQEGAELRAEEGQRQEEVVQQAALEETPAPQLSEEDQMKSDLIGEIERYNALPTKERSKLENKALKNRIKGMARELDKKYPNKRGSYEQQGTVKGDIPKPAYLKRPAKKSSDTPTGIRPGNKRPGQAKPEVQRVVNILKELFRSGRYKAGMFPGINADSRHTRQLVKELDGDVPNNRVQSVLQLAEQIVESGGIEMAESTDQRQQGFMQRKAEVPFEALEQEYNELMSDVDYVLNTDSKALAEQAEQYLQEQEIHNEQLQKEHEQEQRELEDGAGTEETGRSEPVKKRKRTAPVDPPKVSRSGKTGKGETELGAGKPKAQTKPKAQEKAQPKEKVKRPTLAEVQEQGKAKQKELDKKVKDIKERIRQKSLGRLNTIPLDLIPDYIELGAVYVQKGFFKAKEFYDIMNAAHYEIMGARKDIPVDQLEYLRKQSIKAVAGFDPDPSVQTVLDENEFSSGRAKVSQFVQKQLQADVYNPEAKKGMQGELMQDKQSVQNATDALNKLFDKTIKDFGTKEGLTALGEAFKKGQFPPLIEALAGQKIQLGMQEAGMVGQSVEIFKERAKKAGDAGRALKGFAVAQDDLGQVVKTAMDAVAGMDVAAQEMMDAQMEYEGETLPVREVIERMKGKIDTLVQERDEALEKAKARAAKEGKPKSRAKQLREDGLNKIAKAFESLFTKKAVDDSSGRELLDIIDGLKMVFQSYIDEAVTSSTEQAKKRRMKSAYARARNTVIKAAKKAGASEKELKDIEELAAMSKMAILRDALPPAELEALYNDLIKAEVEKAVFGMSKAKKDDALKKRKTRPKRPDINKLVDMASKGGLDDNAIAETVADVLGIERLNQADREHVLKMAKEIQEYESRGNETIADDMKIRLMDYLVSKGISKETFLEKFQDIWFTSTLSSPTTFENATSGTAWTVGLSVASDMLYNPVGSSVALKYLFKGMSGAWRPAARRFKDGYAPNTFAGNNVRGTGFLSRNLYNKSFKTLAKENPALARRAALQAAKFFMQPIAYGIRALQALDVMTTYGTVEFNAALAEYYKARKSGKIKDAIRATHRAMANGYNSEAQRIARQEYEALKGLYNDGLISIKPDPSYMTDRKRELIRKKREKDGFMDEKTMETANKMAMQDVLMAEPEGALSMVYNSFSNMINPSQGATGPVPFMQTMAKLFLFPFLRVGTNFVNSALDFVPPIGAARAAMSTRTVRGGQKERTLLERQRHAARAMMGTATAAIVSALALDWDDEEEEIGLRDGSWLQITSTGTGDWKSNLQLSDDWQEWSFRVKNPVTGKYSGWISYKFSPIGIILAPIGFISDEIRIRDFDRKMKGKADDIKQKTIGYALSTTPLWMLQFGMSQSFQEGLRNAGNLIPSNMTDSERWVENISKAAIRTAQPMVWPRLYSKMYEQYKAHAGVSQKDLKGVEKLANNVPVMEQIFSGEKHDMFGYPIRANKDTPLVPNAIEEMVFGNLDYRKGKKAWKLVFKHENMYIGGFNAIQKDIKGNRLSNDDKQEYLKMVGTEFRELVESKYDQLDKLDVERLYAVLNLYQSAAKKTAKAKFRVGQSGDPKKRSRSLLD